MKVLKSVLYSLIVLLVLSSTASATSLFQEPPEILYVKEGGTGECSSWDDACDLQTAITKLPYKIYVAEGTYYPSQSDREASFNLVSGLQIFGGFPAAGGTWEERNWQDHETILSGDIDGDGTLENNSIHVLTATDVNHLARLDGFNITGGNADLMESLITSSGAGMYNSNSNPILSNLNFIGNSARRGAGMYNDQSSPTLSNVIFSQNSAGDGGGMYNDQSNPTLTTVTFSANSSSNLGGGMYNIDSSPMLTDVTFKDNVGGGMYNEHGSPTLNYVLFFANSSNQGGGMRNQGGGSPIFTNVSFIGNTANRGGGLANVYSSPTLFNVTFFDNKAIDATSQSGLGGGMANYNSSPELTNITFSANTSSGHGGGLYNEQSSNPLLTNVTFTGNTAAISGGGVVNFGANPESLPSNPVITNTILWANSPDQIFNSGISSASVSYSVIQDGYLDGTAIITDDPLLGPLANNGGFTQTHALGDGSSAIDAGDPSVCPATDQRGVVRPIGSGCDIGAYEYEPKIFLPIVIK
jgi:predicted outer membrane repeat protein